MDDLTVIKVQIWLIIACCLIIGFVIGRLIPSNKPVGTFTINHSDPQVDLCNLKLEEDLDYIENHKTMVLKIVVEGTPTDE